MRHPGVRLRLRGLRRRTLVVLGALAVAGVVGGVAWATIPNDGVINACYSKSGGALRVIDASVTNCKKGETALSWNESGPAGEPGPQGEPGPTGPLAVFATNQLPGGGLVLTGEDQTVVSLDLPEGWAFEALVYYTVELNNSGDAGFLECGGQTPGVHFAVPATEPSWGNPQRPDVLTWQRSMDGLFGGGEIWLACKLLYVGGNPAVNVTQASVSLAPVSLGPIGG